MSISKKLMDKMTKSLSQVINIKAVLRVKQCPAYIKVRPFKKNKI